MTIVTRQFSRLGLLTLLALSLLAAAPATHAAVSFTQRCRQQRRQIHEAAMTVDEKLTVSRREYLLTGGSE